MTGPDLRFAAGLCASCRWARVVESARGSTFWRCGRSDVDARFRRYPALPVRVCDGYEPIDPPPEASSRAILDA